MTRTKQLNIGRQIHIRISEGTHRRMRIRVAELDTRIQDWVESLVVDALKLRKKGKANK